MEFGRVHWHVFIKKERLQRIVGMNAIDGEEGTKQTRENGRKCNEASACAAHC